MGHATMNILAILLLSVAVGSVSLAPAQNPAVGCADGTREGFQGLSAFPDIAACAGAWTGGIHGTSAAALCAPGWSVCSPPIYRSHRQIVGGITFDQARSFDGCYPFAAAHDNFQCLPCSGNAYADELGGMGRSCERAGQFRSENSCLLDGRIDAYCCEESTTRFPCAQNPDDPYQGVICCRDSTTDSFSRRALQLLRLLENERFAEAEGEARKLLADAEREHGLDSLWAADSAHLLVDVLRRAGKGKEPETLQLSERVLAIKEKVLGSDHPDVSGYVAIVSSILTEELGDFEASVELMRRSPSNERDLGAHAWRLLLKGETMAALEMSLRAEEKRRQYVHLVVKGLSESVATEYVANRPAGWNVALTVAANTASDPSPMASGSLDALIRARALVLDEMARRHRIILELEDAEISRLAGQLEDSRRELARLVVGTADKGSEDYQSRLKRAREVMESSASALAERSAAFRQQQAREELGLKEVLGALGPDVALVSYARYNHYQTEGQFSTVSYIAFVLRSQNREPIAIPLGPAAKIEEIVTSLRQQMAEISVDPVRSTKRSVISYRLLGESLRQTVWDPIIPYLREAKLVLVVPDGSLNLVNMSALPVGASGYLIERGPVIHYVSAERDLVAPETKHEGRGLLALGDPAFDEPRVIASLNPEAEAKGTGAGRYRGPRSSCGSFRTMRFTPLQAAARELDEITSLWQQAPGTATEITLRGTAATEAAFKDMAPGRRVLHVATHGFFLGGACASALATGGEDSDVLRENPLLLSGLVLAGANHREAAGENEEDGILTAQEIASLDLTDVEWAVLSACDTGLGEINTGGNLGEGVFGLRRAFQIAGARSVIMSLWAVEDEPTREWMTALYRHRFIDGMSTAEAVHTASLDLLNARRKKGQSTHPFYWAGFVAAGDWK